MTCPWSHLLTWSRLGLCSILHPATRGWWRHFGFTFKKPSIFIYSSVELQVGSDADRGVNGRGMWSLMNLKLLEDKTLTNSCSIRYQTSGDIFPSVIICSIVCSFCLCPAGSLHSLIKGHSEVMICFLNLFLNYFMLWKWKKDICTFKNRVCVSVWERKWQRECTFVSSSLLQKYRSQPRPVLRGQPAHVAMETGPPLRSRRETKHPPINKLLE